MKLKQLAAPCVPERHVVIYIMLGGTVGHRSNQDCRPPFQIWKVKKGGVGGTKQANVHVCGPRAACKIDHRTTCMSICSGTNTPSSRHTCITWRQIPQHSDESEEAGIQLKANTTGAPRAEAPGSLRARG